MNIHGYKPNLRKARDMLKQEMAKGKKADQRRIKDIKAGMENLREHILRLRKNKREVKKRNG